MGPEQLGGALHTWAVRLQRHQPRVFAPRSWLRRAAVAVILREGSRGVDVLLAERAIFPGDRWSGHLAFPGGLAAAGDSGALSTAKRETREELGMDLALTACPIGLLSELPTASHGSLAPLVVAPCVFALLRPSEPVLGPELTRVHWVDVAGLAARRRSRSRIGRALGWLSPRQGPAVGGRRLWGLSLAFVDELVDLE